MIELLVAEPLLLLFLVAALGWPLGRIPIAGSRLGVAAVLFAGLCIGALDPRLRLPDILYMLGLLLFIYPMGLASGPAFFRSFRRKGLRDNLLVASILVVSAGLAFVLARLLGLTPAMAAGLFAGSLTNTPALAAVLEAVEGGGGDASAPVVGYSIAYPVGVLGVILAMALVQRIWRVDYEAEARRLADLGATSVALESRTIEVWGDAADRPLVDAARAADAEVVFTRAETAEGVRPVDASTRVVPGGRVTVVGTPDALDAVQEELGVKADLPLQYDRTHLDYRRIFVSSSHVAGRRIRDLDLPRRYGAIISRVRRGDVELRADPDMVLELGDRVRVVAPRERLGEVSTFFGDSYRALGEINVLTFGLGLFLGILVGQIPIPLPGGVTLRLGLAGGPLVVGLVLGARASFGRLVWTMPYTANLTIRQIGLVLFFAGVGTRAGYAFFQTLARPQGLVLLAAGAVLTTATAFLALWIGHRRLGMPMSLLTGTVAALHTQPAVLTYAAEQTANDVPNIGYATVFPTATVLKILLAQLLLTGLG